MLTAPARSSPRISGRANCSHLTPQWRPRLRLSFRTSHLGRDSQSDAHYQDLLQKAEHCTFHSPHGQMQGRAGRRSVLEDGERILGRCKALRPEAVQPRVMLLHNLLLQGRGREEEVPAEVLELLHDTHLRQCPATCSTDAKQALEAVKLGLQALQAAGKPHRVPEFVQLASLAVPELKTAILEQLDYAGRKAHRRRLPFFGTDSFDDLN